MRTLSLRARLTLWYAVTLVVVVVIFGVDVLLVQQRFGVRRVDRELDTVHATLANVLREEMGELNDATLAATEARDAMASLGDAIAILDSRGEPLAAELNGLPLAELLAGVGGWWLASVGLRPVRDMARRATSIPLTGLEDLGPPPRDEELGQLARAFNGLVARLRAALQTQRQI